MNNYFVYMLACSDGTYYVGITNDIERRVSEHKLGIDVMCYTFTRRPLKLVFSTYFHEVTQAIAFEKQLKGWGQDKKRALIEGDWNRIRELAQCTEAKRLCDATLRQAQGDTDSGHPSTSSG